MRSSPAFWLAALAVVAATGCAELAQLTNPRDEVELVAGVREVLRVGAERGVSRASRPGGFLENPAVRIPLPAQLDPIAAGLRAVGLRGTVEELEVSMNRAAERASGEAAELLFDAVRQLSISDARAIVYGPDDAATSYLRARTESGLRARFAPIVATSMKRVGLHRTYEELLDRSRLVNVPGVSSFSLEDYVTTRTVDGLFTVLGQEERRIRDDPAARTTEVLREVFGGL